MQLIVITDAGAVNGEATIINQLFKAGLSRLHLRKPGSTSRQTCALLDQIDAAFYNRIALHQHHQVAQIYRIKRLHYTALVRKKVPPALLGALQMQGYTLSTSIHDLAELDSLKTFDHTFFGPVFNSLSKPGYNSSLPPAFRVDKREAKPQIIALGGITSEQLPTVKAMGFDGAAVLGSIWNEPDNALRTFEQLKNIANTL